MKLSRHAAFEFYFPPITQDEQFMAWLRRCADRVGAFLAASRLLTLIPSSEAEQYLAQACNHADLERRLRDVQYGSGNLSVWR